MRPQALVSLLILSLLSLPGCLGGGFDEPEEVDPRSCWSQPFEGGGPAKGGDILVNGQIILAEGAPHQGQVVWGEAENVSSFWGVATLGLLCLIHDEDNNSVCSKTTTEVPLNASGGFQFMVDQEDTERLGLLGSTLNTFTILAQANESDAWLKADLTLDASKVTLPTFQFFTYPLTLSEEDQALVLTSGEMPQMACMRPKIESVFESDEELVWREEGQRVDARLLEDFNGKAFLEFGYYNEGKGPITSYALGSQSQPFQGKGAPPSRGASCTLKTIDPFESCPLTDGSLEEITLVDGDAVIDLGTRQEISLIAIRGSFFWALVESSLDGEAWELLNESVSGPRALVTPSITARYIKVRQSNDPNQRAGIGGLAEVSIW